MVNIVGSNSECGKWQCAFVFVCRVCVRMRVEEAKERQLPQKQWKKIQLCGRKVKKTVETPNR